MRATIISRSSNPLSWSNDRVGKTYEVLTEREAGEERNQTGEQEIVLKVTECNGNYFKGIIRRSEVEIEEEETTYARNEFPTCGLGATV